MGNLMTQRRTYDRNPEGEPTTEPPRAQPAAPKAKSEGTSTIKLLLLAGASAVVGAVAIDFYRKIKGGGGGDGDDHPAPAATPALPASMPGQTFIPMPMMIPMPMGGGMGYGMQQPMPPQPQQQMRNSGSEEDEEKALMKRFAKDLARKKVVAELNRKRIEEVANEFMEDA